MSQGGHGDIPALGQVEQPERHQPLCAGWTREQLVGEQLLGEQLLRELVANRTDHRRTAVQQNSWTTEQLQGSAQPCQGGAVGTRSCTPWNIIFINV